MNCNNIKKLGVIFASSRSSEDSEKLLSIATQLNAQLSNPIEPLDNEAIINLAYTAQGSFVPLTAAMGGIVAQEVLKALTGKFTPLNQWVSPSLIKLTKCQNSEFWKTTRFSRYPFCFIIKPYFFLFIYKL